MKRIANNSQDVIALIKETKFFFQAMIAQLFAVICSHDDDGVFPHAKFNKRVPHATELLINIADHAVVLRNHVANFFFIGRRGGTRNLQCKIVEWMTLIRWGNWHWHICWVVRGRPFSCSGIRRMRAKVTGMCKPRPILLAQPCKKVIRKKCRHSEFCWA